MAAEPDDADWLKQMREALRDTAVQQLRLIYELKQRHGQYVGSAPAQLVGPKTGVSDVLFDLARLSTRTYEQWLKLGMRHFDFIADSLLGPKAKTMPGYRHPGASSRITVKARGSLGGEAIGRFFVKNPQNTQAYVRFTLPILTSHDGQRLRGTVSFCRADTSNHPECGDDMVLGPAEEARFLVVVGLPADTVPGCYRGEACVIVGAQMIGELCLEIEAGQPQPTQQMPASGTPGELAVTTAFTVHNPLSSPAAAAISTPVVFNGSGLSPFAAEAKLISSSAALLGAGQQAQLQTSMAIPAGTAPGHYTGDACVLVGVQPVLQVTVALEVRSA